MSHIVHLVSIIGLSIGLMGSLAHASENCPPGSLVCPDACLWIGGVNPDGSRAIPIVGYEPESGIMYVNTLGLNQVMDTTSGDMIGADDVGMISLSVEGPEATPILPAGFVESQFGGGVLWNVQYFAGKMQGYGVSAGAQYFDPTERIEMFQYEPGLRASDFGNVEMAVNFAPGNPGDILFGGVTIVPVPEPTFGTLGMLIALAALLIRRRAHSTCVG